ncbi:MAG: prepilin-type N-terminal cleavage/methylation domain-containing protein, partial [Fimbriimonadaceae bacterium]|nr:prepilin-type N-terminal cleavage/methylation domain-containing protein [Fimbriimonadaceae bacterium]
MRRNSAFTLIELLVVIAIIAILAAILFPVFAEAKSSAKKTASLSGLKQLALGLQMYSTDFDDLAVHEYGFSTPDQSNFYLNGNTWVGRVMPYVKNRSIFWDKTVTEPTGDILPSVNFAPDTYRWEWTTTFSINTEGYSRHYGGSSCLDTNWSGPTSPRSLTGIEDSAQRLAI